MKISVIGAGNVGALAAMNISRANLGDVVLVDVAGNMARGKSLDIDDALALGKVNYTVQGTEDIKAIEGSGVVVITAGLARKPGMTREDLAAKNAIIMKELCSGIKKHAPQSVVVVVTNPLDLMTQVVLKQTGFKPNKVMGMGITLDSARFANIISHALCMPKSDINAFVIGTHGEGMLPLPRLSTVKEVPLDRVADKQSCLEMMKRTIQRGLEIVNFLGSGSAYFAPALAIFELVKAIAQDSRAGLGVSTYLDGEYGIKGVCIGVPCIIGKNGIQKIIQVPLDKPEIEALQSSAESLRAMFLALPA